MKDYLRLMRPRHYIKNALVFAPLVFSGGFFRWPLLRGALLGFCAFCLLSSAVYIVNDIRDAAKDRLHPVKCRRPVASGAVPVKSAWCLCGVLLAAAAALQVFAGRDWPGFLYLGLYLAINLAYSFGLKDYPIVDIAILSAGFLLRVLYGAAVTGIEVSGWLYLTVISVSFYFALGKRRNELVRQGSGDTRRVLRYYSKPFLDKNMYMFLGLANVFYALWSMEHENRALLWTVPVILLICMRYSLDVEGDSDGDPVEVLLHDWVLIALCAAYVLAMMLILYV